MNPSTPLVNTFIRDLLIRYSTPAFISRLPSVLQALAQNTFELQNTQPPETVPTLLHLSARVARKLPEVQRLQLPTELFAYCHPNISVTEAQQTQALNALQFLSPLSFGPIPAHSLTRAFDLLKCAFEKGDVSYFHSVLEFCAQTHCTAFLLGGLAPTVLASRSHEEKKPLIEIIKARFISMYQPNAYYGPLSFYLLLLSEDELNVLPSPLNSDCIFHILEFLNKNGCAWNAFQKYTASFYPRLNAKMQCTWNLFTLFIWAQQDTTGWSLEERSAAQNQVPVFPSKSAST